MSLNRILNPPTILSLPGDCKTCRGYGEIVSPEDLETVLCTDCDGSGVA